MQIQIEYIGRRKRRGGQGREELLIDGSLPDFADRRARGTGGMRREQHTHHRPCRGELDLLAIVKRATSPRLGVNSYLIRWELQALLNSRLLDQMIRLASHHHRRSLCSPIWIVRQQIRQRSRITIQAIEANDDARERKRERVGIGRNDAARPLEFLAILPIARVAKCAQPLVRVRLQNRRPCSGHFPALASQVSRSTDPVKTAMNRRQVWGGWKRALASCLFGAIHIHEQPLSIQPIPQPSRRSAERRARQQVFQKQRAQRLHTRLIQDRQIPREGRWGGKIGSAKQRHEFAGKRLDALAKRPQRRLSAHCIANEHRHKINQFILAHPGAHKPHALLDGFEDPVSLERMRHHSHFPKPGRRARRVRRVHLDVDDRIGHLPLLPFSLVFSQEDTFLSSLPVFQGFLPLFGSLVAYPVGM